MKLRRKDSVDERRGKAAENRELKLAEKLFNIESWISGGRKTAIVIGMQLYDTASKDNHLQLFLFNTRHLFIFQSLYGLTTFGLVNWLHS